MRVRGVRPGRTPGPATPPHAGGNHRAPGEPTGSSWRAAAFDDPYCAMIRSQTKQGKRVERVRITDEPPTPGQLYLLDNAKRNAALGEDIRNLRRV